METNELIKNRIAKLDKLEQDGVAGYPNDFKPTFTTADILARFGDMDSERLERDGTEVVIAGRMMTVRVMGKAAFLHLKDRAGMIQAYVKKDSVGEESYARFKLFEPGDIVGVVGHLMRTRTGELTVAAKQIRLVTKSLRPLPEKFHGLSDMETRYRQRYVDLSVNDSTRDIFRARSKIVKYIRDFLDERSFMEVETPMMHPIPGGAAARPFITHHNSLDMELYLRIAPELYLKRLLVGGFERVYEVNRSFRNEGLSLRHNPEFTMLEFYWAYATYEDLIELTEELICGLALEIHGQLKIPCGDREVDLTRPWKRVTMGQAVAETTGWTPEQLEDQGFLRGWLKRREVEVPEDAGLGKLIAEVYDQVVEPEILNPTFIVNHPVEISPLARRNDKDPTIVDRFELVIAGREICNAFSELNDPRDQRRRFEDQVARRAAGDDEAQHMDLDYLRALEFGMPPAAGEGIGIDRLVMLLTNQNSIKEVILFPLLRPELVKLPGGDGEEPEEETEE